MATTVPYQIGDWVRHLKGKGPVPRKTLGRVTTIVDVGLWIKWDTEAAAFLYDWPKHATWFEKISISSTERICRVCLRTCDVGLPCWLCGGLI